MHHRVFVDYDGRTQFEPLDLSALSAAAVSARCSFFTRPPGAVQDWHNADSPMFIITLSGEMEVESEVDAGTAVRLYLPCHEAAESEVAR